MSGAPCPFCGAASAGPSPGATCERCLMRFARREEERSLAGEYELYEALGEGATGTVHRAEHRGTGEVVAIKLAKPEFVAEPAAAKLFLRQARTESLLRHPHIVGVQGTGTYAGRPFLVMPWMEGGTLADVATLKRFPSLKQRLALIIKIARAVQFAHERGVLHCDLKPENILFDAADEPHVSDFGMARAVHESTAEGFYGGSPGYMSPEQIRREPLTTASDVFALGAILYFLITGAPAFPSGPAETARVTPAPLPRYRPSVDWAALAVASRALSARAEHRYSSASALVEDLERIQSHHAPRGQRVPWPGKVWCWAQRHPGARNALLLLLPCFALLAVASARAQHEELRRAVLDMNAHSASGQAAAVLYQLREYADKVERAASDPEVRALVLPALGEGHREPCAGRAALSEPGPLEPHAQGFATMVALDANTCARARIPAEPLTPEFISQRHGWRQYLGRDLEGSPGEPGTWVRHAYRSSVTGLIKFAVSTPIFEADASPKAPRVGAPRAGAPRPIGVVTGSVTVASTLELPRLRRMEHSDRFTVLIGPFAEDVNTAVPRPEFAFLVHPRLAPGEKVTLDGDLARDLHERFRQSIDTDNQFDLATVVPFELRDYSDPFLGQRWLAAFAPVGGTGYFVLVQSLDDQAIRPSLWGLRLGLALFGIWAALAISWGVFIAWGRVASQRFALRVSTNLPSSDESSAR